ncbi:DIS3-like exonuclease 2 [Tachysurus ichikawai]
MDEMMESSCEATEKRRGQNQSRTPGGTRRTSQQNGPSESDTLDQKHNEPDVKPRRPEQKTTSESENPQTDITKRRRHKPRRNKQAPGGAEAGTADHLTHTAPNQQQKKHYHKHPNTDATTLPHIDDSTAPDDEGGEKQKRKKKKQKKSRENTEDKPVKLCESGAVEKRNTPRKNTQGDV